MPPLSYECIGVVVALVIVAIIATISTNRTLKSIQGAHAEGLKQLPLAELERNVYRYETEYFRIIGEENEIVREFKQLIENRNLSTIYAQWESRFAGGFIDLERKAGHVGKPLLGEDYYSWYHLEVKELYERNKAEL